MWICPKCLHQFYNTNQSHSCGSYTVADFLSNRSEKTISLFNYFIAEYQKIGGFVLHPVKTRVALLTKMRFCAINKIGVDYIDLHLVLTQSYSDAICFYKIDNLGDRFFIHHLRLFEPSDITDEVRLYMQLAYDTGNRMHIIGKKR